MGSILPEEIIEEIKEKNEITEVISQYIQIKAMGANYKALCPFHSEKTPSFVINGQRQSFKCFGCGEGGDVIQFIMKIENLDFVEAIKLLAQRANIPLERLNATNELKKELQKKMLYHEIHNKAGKFYFNQLTKHNNPALNYLIKRGLSAKTIKAFGLGYAYNSWNELFRFLKGAGYSTEDLLKCGLILPNKEKTDYYDRFRNRIIFPIFDVRGNVIGFGGRVLDQSLPKYLNSPETEIFNKSNTIYGLNFARRHIVNEQLLLVEGYMDVIALHQHGIKNAVAALGTSFTKGHASILKKYCKELIICFDGDEAGQKAALRSIDILQESGLSSKMIELPNKMDPDDYINQYGKYQFEEQIQRAISPIEYKINLAKRKFDLNLPEGKIKFVKALAMVLKQIKSPVEREVYIDKIEKETGVSKEALQLEIYGRSIEGSQDAKQKYSSRNKRDNKYIDAVPLAEQKGHLIAEQQLIKTMLTNEKVLAQVLSKIMVEDFSTEAHQRIVDHILKRYHQGAEITLEGLDHLKNEIDEIYSTDINHIDIDKTLEAYVDNLKRFKSLYQLKLLREKQNTLLQDKKLNKEEVEKELLKIGLEIMKINTELKRR